MDTYDITGLDPASAKEYVLAAISTLKQTTEKRLELEREIEIWSKRVALAKEHSRSDLQAQAETRVFEVRQNLDRIRNEEAGLNGGVIRLKSQLKMILNQPELEYDADQLSAELELLAGEHDELAEKFREEEALDALERLKREMDQEGQDTEA